MAGRLLRPSMLLGRRLVDGRSTRPAIPATVEARSPDLRFLARPRL